MSCQRVFSVLILLNLICLQGFSANSPLDSLKSGGQSLYLKDSSSVFIKDDTLLIGCSTRGLTLFFTGCDGQQVRWTDSYVGDSIFVNNYSNLFPRCGVNTPLDSSKFATVVLFDDPPILPTITINRQNSDLCQNSIVLLSSNCNGLDSGETIWQDSISINPFLVSANGIYKTICKNQCGIGEPSYTTVLDANIDLTYSISSTKINICDGEEAILKAKSNLPGGVINYNANQLIWNNGSTDSIITVSQPGNYSFVVVPFCADTIKSDTLGILPGVDKPAVQAFDKLGNLLSNVLIHICTGDSIRLDASNCLGTINWNNGKTGNNIYIRNSGFYSATCTTSCGISENSEIVALEANICNIQPAILDVSSVVNYCAGDSATLIVSCDVGQIQWDNSIYGSASTIRVLAGQYIVRCVTIDDTSNPLYIDVSQISSPNGPVATTSKAILCGNEFATLVASGCINGSSVLWSSGETIAQITKNSTGIFTAVCTNMCGKSQNSNEIRITNFNVPENVVVSQETITDSNGQKSVLLSASNCTYQTRWSTGENSQNIKVVPGNYSAQCVNPCGFGTEVTIEAKFSELNCKEICIPLKVRKIHGD